MSIFVPSLKILALRVFKLILFLILFSNGCFCPSQAHAQVSQQQVSFFLFFNTSQIVPESGYFKWNKVDSVYVETLKFYISNLQLLQDGAIVFSEKKRVHLLDFENLNSLSITLQLPSEIRYNQFRFDLGIDSITNVSGALGGDLDPTKGMYWTWQSGYINTKIEGKSNACKTRGKAFQFHLGGYQWPNNCLQTLHFDTEKNANIKIGLNVSNWLNQIELSSQNQIMSPGAMALELSKKLAACFYLLHP